jgi:hypothetical protein
LKTARVYPFSGNGGSWREAVIDGNLTTDISMVAARTQAK